MAEKEKKNSRRRTPAGENVSRQQDQVLSGVQNAPKIGKIAGPKKNTGKSRGKTEQKKRRRKAPPRARPKPPPNPHLQQREAASGALPGAGASLKNPP